MAVLLIYNELRQHGVFLSRSQLRRLEQAGKFPKRVQISDARVGWVEKEIDDWIEQKVNARQKSALPTRSQAHSWGAQPVTDLTK